MYNLKVGGYVIVCGEAGLAELDKAFNEAVKEYCKGVYFNNYKIKTMGKYIRRKDEPTYDVVVWDGKQETIDVIKSFIASNKVEEPYKGEFKVVDEDLFIIESNWVEVVKLGDYVLVTSENWVSVEKPENFEKKYEQA